MNGLALCAGIGGIELGIASVIPDYRTVCYVEGEAYAAATLAARVGEGRLDPAPIWSDLRTFDGTAWRGVVDIITAGYPCQPFSVAGKRGGASDPRHLWPHVARTIGECAPSCVFLENVPGHVSLGLATVWRDLRAMGYEVEAGYFAAQEVGAPHVRNRLFILAANVDGQRQLQQDGFECAQRQRLGYGVGWSTEPALGRVVHGVSAGVDRLRALGNAVVPQCAAYAFETLWERLA